MFYQQEWVAGWVFLERTCRGQWERRGRLLAPDLQRYLDDMPSERPLR